MRWFINESLTTTQRIRIYWLNSVSRCKIGGISYAPYVSFSDCTAKTPAVKRAAINTQWAFVDSAIKAVYAYAKALKNAQSAMCVGSGVCQGLRQMSPATFHDYLKAVNFNVSVVEVFNPWFEIGTSPVGLKC